jgi:translation elongation factor P/translation initiation factor 5A
MVEVPEITKGNAQINFIEDTSINVMNLETYESLDVDWPQDEDLKKKLKEIQANPDNISSTQVEYWQLAGKTLINRVFST